MELAGLEPATSWVRFMRSGHQRASTRILMTFSVAGLRVAAGLYLPTDLPTKEELAAHRSPQLVVPLQPIELVDVAATALANAASALRTG
jgi:hypothetical protein